MGILIQKALFWSPDNTQSASERNLKVRPGTLTVALPLPLSRLERREFTSCAVESAQCASSLAGVEAAVSMTPIN